MKPPLRRLLPPARLFLCITCLAALASTAHADDGPFALSFDGTNDYVFAPHSTLFNNDQLTITAWIKTSQTTGEAGLINKYVAGSFNGWNLFLFNGEVRAWYFGDNSNFIWDGGRGLNGGFVANGQWHHVAFTVAFDGGRLYLDGLLRSSLGWTGSQRAATTTQELRLGSYPGSGFYNGLLDEVIVWSKTLSAAEISGGRPNSLIGTERELRGYFRLTEGSGNTARNSAFSGPFSPATLTNGPVWVAGAVLKPAVMTLPPIAITSGSARLNGVASPGGTNASAWFEWGTTTNYGTATPAQPQGGGGNETNFSHSLTGLTPDVTVQFRAVASNALGVAFGSNFSFTPFAINLTREREGHTATLLPNGKVLVAGGFGASINGFGFSTNSAELYDPATGNWTLKGPLNTSRRHHTATLLQNGKVLVAGGEDSSNFAALSSAELYDPISGTWTNTGPMHVPRQVHTATLLINGQVLAVGGTDGTNYLTSSERYDPAGGTWTRVGEPLFNRRGYHSATLLPRGAVLVVGGYPGFPSTAEVLEPNSDVWRPTVMPNTTRWNHTATLLHGGQVLLVGGYDENTSPIASVELYDPHNGAWTATVPMANARYGHSSTLLPNGRVLVGGFGNTQVYDPTNNAWSNAPAMNTPRNSHTATLLRSGKVLVAGGTDGGFNAISSAELFDPASST